MANYLLDQTGAEVQAILNAVQAPDTTPVEGSTKLITSGGVQAALAGTAQELNAEVAALGQKVDVIKGVKTAFDVDVSKNLFDKNVPEEYGYINSTTGAIDSSTNPAHTHTYAIPVEPNKYYYLSGRNGSSTAVRCLDSGGNPVKVCAAETGTPRSDWFLPDEAGSGTALNGQFKTPADVVSFQCNIKFSNTGDANSIMLSEVGDTYVPNMPAPEYEDFGDVWTLKEDAIPATAKQLLSEQAEINDDVITSKSNTNVFNKNNTQAVGYINSTTGVLEGTSNQAHRTSYPIPVEPNHYYYLAGRDSSSSMTIRCLDENNSPIKVCAAATGNPRSSDWFLPNNAGNGVVYNGQFKTPADAVSVQFTFMFSSSGDADDIMLLDLGTMYFSDPVIPEYVAFGEKVYFVKDSAIIPSMLSKLRDKSVRMFGGSVAELCGRYGGVQVMEKMSGCKIQDDAVSGAGFAKGTTISGGVPSFEANGICDQVNKATSIGQPQFDIYILWAGINDVGLTYGDPDDYSYFDSYDVNKLTRVCGGMNYCIKQLQTFAPESHIIFIGSLKNFPDGANIGSSLELYVQKQKEVAKLQSVPFFSLWDNGGVNFYNKDTFFTRTVDVEGVNANDGTHPNKWAYENVIAPKLIKQIALLW